MDYQIIGFQNNKTRISHLVRTTSGVGEFSTELELLVNLSIVDDLPPESIDITSWNIQPNLELAYPRFSLAGQIDMLLGVKLF